RDDRVELSPADREHRASCGAEREVGDRTGRVGVLLLQSMTRQTLGRSIDDLLGRMPTGQAEALADHHHRTHAEGRCDTNRRACDRSPPRRSHGWIVTGRLTKRRDTDRLVDYSGVAAHRLV